MFKYLDSALSINTLIWLFPLVFLIHDGEELLTVERWLQAHLPRLEERFGHLPVAGAVLRRARGTTTARFGVMVAWLLAAVCAASYLGARGHYLWFLAGIGVLLVNCLTHLGQSAAVGGYTPGVVTAVLVALPYALYAYHRLLTARLADWPTIWVSLPLGLALVAGFFLLGYLTADRWVR